MVRRRERDFVGIDWFRSRTARANGRLPLSALSGQQLIEISDRTLLRFAHDGFLKESDFSEST
ncbi:hypothetical protein LAM67_25080, partial [Mycobacterium tuberculosis]|nr:hypothetical protein [Mycobacterium tuberculosis]